jgi:hypothetical protein
MGVGRSQAFTRPKRVITRRPADPDGFSLAAGGHDRDRFSVLWDDGNGR